jgi:uncharacterized protein YkwD
VSAIGRLSGVRGSRRGGRVLVVVLMLAAFLAVTVGGLWASPARAATGVGYSTEEIDLLELLNQHRQANGLQPLLLSDTLSLAAERHGSDMGKYHFFSHRTGYNSAMTQALSGTRSDWFAKGAYPWDRMTACGYNYNTDTGENIAAGQRTAQAVFTDFSNSAGHNQVMLFPDFKVVGIALVAVAGSDYGYYWTMDFGGTVDASAHAPGIYQQNDSRITYLGSWTTRSWDSAASGASWCYAGDSSAAALISFEGTSIEVLAKKGSVYGLAEVSLDGGAAETVDFYSASSLYKQSVYKKTDLSSGTHTIVIRCLGQPSGASGGCTVDIDAIKVTGVGGVPGMLVQGPLPVRHQQEETSLFAYTGGWVSSGTTWLASGGSYYYANSPGASVNVTFDGTYVSWVAKRGPGYGEAWVSLDGQEPVMVDLYSYRDLYKQKVYETGLLADGQHTLSIYWLGQKNAAASNYTIDVDTLDVLGTFTKAPQAGPITWLYQQNDPRITYLGPWSNRWAGSASGGSFCYTSTETAAAIVNFTGESVELLAKKGPVYGIVEISLDGGEPKTVDLYSSADAFGQPVYKQEGLSEGTHTLTIECTGEQNDASGGCVVDVDALNIKGWMTKGPTLTRYQENTDLDPYPTFEYTGSWSTGWTWSASGGTFVSTSVSGSDVTITFSGTYLSWLARTTPWYGKAEVSLDGGDPVPVDLYSSTVGWKKAVYNTGLLDAGVHTIVISYTGTRNALASGTAISVDAADVIVTE